MCKTNSMPNALDPEILQDHSPHTASDDADVSLWLQRAFAGRVVKSHGTRLVVSGAAGEFVVLLTPLGAVVVYRGLRTTLPRDAGAAREMLAGIADGSLVLMQERGTAALRRTHLVRMHGGVPIELVDTGVDRHTMDREALDVVTFATGVTPATAQQRARLRHLTGGVFGLLKRKVMEAVLERTMGALMRAFDQPTPSTSSEAPASPLLPRKR